PPSSGDSVQVTDNTLLIDVSKAEEQIAADQQIARENSPPPGNEHTADGSGTGQSESIEVRNDGNQITDDVAQTESAVESRLSRYFGSVKIDPARYAGDIGNVIREVIDQLAGSGATLDIAIDIHATKPEGFNESEIRTIRENARVLKFEPGSDFENE